ncbi:DUF4179 domain-containing protein [Alicyclobacillus suci]|uniref:DUF4179 domain-containing protein n=1 Tax=Alicyclobacillus suci TaxID=2816080 RepID=UPI001A8F13D5|nr:DUF4179 domain-containing protein [Alicyclobacillus suci]
MKMDDSIRQEAAKFKTHTVDKETFKRNLFNKLAYDPGDLKHKNVHQLSSSNVGLCSKLKIRRATFGLGGGLILLMGGTLLSGFASPTVAQELQCLPLINGIADAIYSSGANTSVQQAVEHGFNIPINKSVTHDGVTITITNAYYGPDASWIGLTESFSKDAKTHATPGQNVQFLLNGQSPGSYGVGFKPMADGSYAGTIDAESLPADLPTSVTASVNIKEIGGIKGDWNFTFPLSRKPATAATQVITPHSSKSVNGVNWTIRKVETTPASILIWGDITVPGTVNPNIQLGILKGNTLQHLGGGVINEHLVKKTVSTSTYDYYAQFDRPAKLPSMIAVAPMVNMAASTLYIPIPEQSRQYENGKFTYLPGSNEQMTITRIARTGKEIDVVYTTVGDQYRVPNEYSLAIDTPVKSKTIPGLSYAKYVHSIGFRVVNPTKHESEVIFPELPDINNAWLTAQESSQSPDKAIFKSILLNKLNLNVPLVQAKK